MDVRGSTLGEGGVEGQREGSKISHEISVPRSINRLSYHSIYYFAFMSTSVILLSIFEIDLILSMARPARHTNTHGRARESDFEAAPALQQLIQMQRAPTCPCE